MSLPKNKKSGKTFRIIFTFCQVLQNKSRDVKGCHSDRNEVSGGRISEGSQWLKYRQDGVRSARKSSLYARFQRRTGGSPGQTTETSELSSGQSRLLRLRISLTTSKGRNQTIRQALPYLVKRSAFHDSFRKTAVRIPFSAAVSVFLRGRMRSG